MLIQDVLDAWLCNKHLESLNTWDWFIYSQVNIL